MCVCLCMVVLNDTTVTKNDYYLILPTFQLKNCSNGFFVIQFVLPVSWQDKWWVIAQMMHLEQHQRKHRDYVLSKLLQCLYSCKYKINNLSFVLPSEIYVISTYPDVQIFLLAWLTDWLWTLYPHIILISPEEMSVELIQHEYGTPHFSTLGDVQLKYSFFPQSKKPPVLKPQQLNSCCTKSMKFWRSGSSL